MPHHSSAPSLQLPPHQPLIGSLPNGLDYLVKSDQSAPVASLQLWFRSGSIHEGPHLGAGLSHFVEHMVFKGTGRRAPMDISRQVQAAGGQINAYTSYDRTVYWLDLPAPQIPFGLDLLADIAFHSAIPPEEFDREQDVIRREFAMGDDDPHSEASKLLLSTVFRHHPYRHPIIGHRQLFDQIDHAALASFYHQHYVPDNAFLVLVGDLDPDAAADLISSHFAGIAMGRRPFHPIPTEPAQVARREHHAEFNTELARLELAWPTPHALHPDIPALDVLAFLLGDGRSSRLYRQIRDGKDLAHQIGAGIFALADHGIFGIDADLLPENLDPAIDATLALVEEIRSTPPSLEELEKARRSILSDQFSRLSTMRGQASDIASSWHGAGTPDHSRTFIGQLQQVTPEDVTRVAATYLSSSSLNLVSLRPRGATPPSSSRPRPTAASSRQLEELTLPNGLRLILCPDRRIPLVTLHAAFLGGVLAETPDSAGASRLLARTLVKGTASRDAQTLAALIEDLGGSFGTSSGNNTVALSVEVMAGDLPVAIDVFSDILVNASIPQKAFAREQKAQLSALKDQEDKLVSLAVRSARQIMFEGQPYALSPLGTPESIASSSRDRLAQLRDRLLVGHNGVCCAIGDFDPDQLRPALVEALSQLPSGAPALDLASLPTIPTFTPGPPRRDTLHRPKEQAVIVIAYPTTAITHPDRMAYDLIDEACSDMASPLFERIREELGLAYFVGASQLLGPMPGAIYFYAGTSPDTIAQVEQEMLAILAKLAADSLPDDELERAKAAYLGKAQLSLQSAGALSQHIAIDALLGLGADRFQRIADDLAAITPDRVRHCLHQSLTAAPTIVHVLPED